MYAQIAPYYDLIHSRLIEDISLVLALAREAGDPILELGCGTGRLLLPLAEAGHTVTGVDNAREMLARARARLAQADPAVRARVILLEASMTDFVVENGRFALAIIAYNTLLHLEPVEAQRAFGCIGRHLQPDGRLFIDIANPFMLEAAPHDGLLGLEQIVDMPEISATAMQFSSSRLDQAAQRIDITWLYDVMPTGGGAVQRTISRMAYHYRYPHQLELALRQAGFKLEAVWGDYNRAPFTEESNRLLLLACK
jgi:SAM-dependent methyltransferase